jgi:hypothetical protein
MSNNNNLTEIQQNSIREYNKEAQHKFIKENPNYYKDQYKNTKSHDLNEQKKNTNRKN